MLSVEGELQQLFLHVKVGVVACYLWVNGKHQEILAETSEHKRSNVRGVSFNAYFASMTSRLQGSY